MITQGDIITIAKESIYTIIITAAPLLLISLIVGLVISIFQTVTSIQEQPLTSPNCSGFSGNYDFRFLDAGCLIRFYDAPVDRL